MAWMDWRNTISQQERVVLAESIAQVDISSRAGVRKLSTLLLVRLFQGDISPVMMEAAKPILQMIIDMLEDDRKEAGLRGPPTRDVLMVLADMKNQLGKPLQPIYQVTQRAEEPELVPAEQRDVVENG